MNRARPAPAPSPAQWWRALPPARRSVVAVVGAVVAANLIVAAVRSSSGSGPRGAPSSSFATAPQGLSAWAALLDGAGHPVRRWREPLDEVDLDPAATLVVADPGGLSPSESVAVVAFVRAGGRLVATGSSAVALTRRMIPGLEWRPDGPRRAVPVVPVPEVAGIDRVVFGGSGSFTSAAGGLPFLAGTDAGGRPSGQVVAVVAEVAEGRIIALAATTPLQNRALALADNAALALRLAGSRGRAVHFAEAAHGYGQASGPFDLDAFPGRWPAAIVTAAAAGAVWAWSRARRLGPPERDSDAAPPPRRAYVDALAAALARTGRPADATVALRERASHRLAVRLGLPAGAAAEEIAAAAGRAGWEPVLVDAVLRPATADADLVALGRAAALLETGVSP